MMSIIITVEDQIKSVKEDIWTKTGFEVTDAVCPLKGLPLMAGFKIMAYYDQIFKRMYAIKIVQTKNLLFELFIDLFLTFFKMNGITKRGICAVFTANHPPILNGEPIYDVSMQERKSHDYITKRIDPIIFSGWLLDFEESLMRNGFWELSFLSRSALVEIRFDMHKEIVFFTKSRKLAMMVRNFLRAQGLLELNEINTIEAGGEHIHIATQSSIDQFYRLIMQSNARRVA